MLKQDLPQRPGSIILWTEYKEPRVGPWEVQAHRAAARQQDGTWLMTGRKRSFDDETLLTRMALLNVPYWHEGAMKHLYDEEHRRAKRANREIWILKEALRHLTGKWVQVSNIVAWQRREGTNHNWLNKNNEKQLPNLFPPAEMWSPGRGWIAHELERYVYDIGRTFAEQIEKWQREHEAKK